MRATANAPWTRVALALSCALLVAACGSTSSQSDEPSRAVQSAPATAAPEDPVAALQSALMCQTDEVWETDSSTWVGFTCPEAGNTSVPARLYVFATNTDRQLFSERAAGIMQQWDYDAVVVGPDWLAFGFANLHRDFLLNAVEQGGELVQ